jgi:hypothetical protein
MRESIPQSGISPSFGLTARRSKIVNQGAL